MNVHGARLIAVAALAAGPLLGGCASRAVLAQAGGSAAAPSALSEDVVLAQQTGPSLPAPAAPGPAVPTPAPPPPIGLPRAKEYRPIPELRDIYFDFGMATIRPGDARVLETNAAWLRANPDHLLLIEGHCDAQGLTSRKNEFNMSLGERRAQAAMNYLVAQGVPASRIIVLSYGEERPLCTEQSERCWRQNRRSRFLVKPR